MFNNYSTIKRYDLSSIGGIYHIFQFYSSNDSLEFIKLLIWKNPVEYFLGCSKLAMYVGIFTTKKIGRIWMFPKSVF